MNYNANTGPRSGIGRKVKRVSHVDAMGYSPYNAPNEQQGIYPNLGPDMENSNYQQGYPSPDPYSQPFANTPQGVNVPGQNYNQPVQTPYPQNSFSMPANLSVLGQPVVQDMAMQYGQQLAGAGTSIIKQEVEKYVPVSKVKFYFAVDTKYVVSKLMLLFFPFTHSDWSVKYEQEGPVQPRYEINAPDLYIPTMSYFTYIVIAGLVLGMQGKLTPEHIGVTASAALAWSLIELAVYSCILYIIQVETSLSSLDLIAYSGYKYLAILTSILVSLVGGKSGFYFTLIYTTFALAFFLVRSLKVQVLAEKGGSDYSQFSGHKRRLYFLLFLAGVQPLLSWWLSFHLIPSTSTKISLDQ